MNWFLMALCIGITPCVYAMSWQDLWATKDQQARVMMDHGQYVKAKESFAREDWRAAAAYRAKEYKQAATIYQSLKDEDAYYNLGNALAYMGNYEQGISAYDKALAINPNNQDALTNRKLLEDLLKKEKQDQKNKDKPDQNKQDQDKQDQDKQDQDKQDQGKQDQDKQDQGKQDQDKQDQGKQDQDKQDQGKQDQGKQDQDKQDQDKQEQDKQEQDKQEQDKQEQDKQEQDKPASQSQDELEKQQAREQWLRLIPDDPGGLMREKFLRDHLRRERGWSQ